MTVVPLGVLFWLGWNLAQQDRATEQQQRRERLQLAADKVIAAIDRAISASEHGLAAGRTDWPDGAVAVALAGDQVEAAPAGRLAYLPVVPPDERCRSRRGSHRVPRPGSSHGRRCLPAPQHLGE